MKHNCNSIKERKEQAIAACNSIKKRKEQAIAACNSQGEMKGTHLSNYIDLLSQV